MKTIFLQIQLEHPDDVYVVYGWGRATTFSSDDRPVFYPPTRKYHIEDLLKAVA